MAKVESNEPQDITPEDSVVPVFLIPLTAEEEAEREQWAIEYAEREKAAEVQIVARQSAIEKLSALGLTVDEISAAFGITPE